MPKILAYSSTATQIRLAAKRLGCNLGLANCGSEFADGMSTHYHGWVVYPREFPSLNTRPRRRGRVNPLESHRGKLPDTGVLVIQSLH